MNIINLDIGEMGAKLHGYLHEKSQSWPDYEYRPCVLVCPGGGYGFLSDRESDPVAFEWLAQGYQVFLLRYSVGEKARDFQPLKELSAAVAAIRQNSAGWGIDPHRVAVIGFSAGAHLTLSLGVYYDSDILEPDHGLNRPDALILSYPVVTAGEYAHEGSFENLSGEKRSEAWKPYSLEHFVSSATPPCFIWHTGNDESVPIQNTLLLINALQSAGVPYECHIYPKGAHGLSLCTGQVRRPGASLDPHPATWFPLCVQWLGQLFDFTK